MANEITSSYLTEFFGEKIAKSATNIEEQAIKDLAKSFYRGDYPTMDTQTKRALMFGTIITIPDQNEEGNLHRIEKALFGLFERGRMFGRQEMICERMANLEKKIGNLNTIVNDF